jgi:ATP-dependent Clp protease protease subunit
MKVNLIMDDIKEAIISQLMEESDLSTWDPHEHKFYGPSTRTLAFFGDVNEDRSRLLISQILHLEQLSETDPITIHLNTQGGSLTDGLAIFDTIKQVSCPVIIVTTGLCASAGLLILSGGDYKLSTENTVFFYHQPVMSDSSVTSMNEMISFSDHYQSCKHIADSIILKNSKMKKSIWNANFKNKTSFYFNAEQALSFNLINDIVESRKIKFKITKD